MPLIDDLIQKKHKKFVKKDYRPWDDEILVGDEKNNVDPDTKINKIFNISEMRPISELDDNKLDEASRDETPLHEEESSILKNDPINAETSTTMARIDLQSKKQRNSLLYRENLENKRTMKPLVLETYARGLYGLQRIMLQTLLDNISHCEDGYGFTKPLFYSDLALSIKSPVNSIKGSIQRLRASGIVEVYEYKPGIGGYSSYKIKEEILDFFINFFQK